MSRLARCPPSTRTIGTRARPDKRFRYLLLPRPLLGALWAPPRRGIEAAPSSAVRARLYCAALSLLPAPSPSGSPPVHLLPPLPSLRSGPRCARQDAARLGPRPFEGRCAEEGFSLPTRPGEAANVATQAGWPRGPWQHGQDHSLYIVTTQRAPWMCSRWSGSTPPKRLYMFSLLCSSLSSLSCFGSSSLSSPSCACEAELLPLRTDFDCSSRSAHGRSVLLFSSVWL